MAHKKNIVSRVLSRLKLSVGNSIANQTHDDLISASVLSLEETKLRIGALHAALMKVNPPATFHDAEFTVFSQFGEDGIIQHLIRNVPGIPSTFIEFGVQDYTEANTRFLLQHNNWKGLILDASEASMRGLRRKHMYWRHDITAVSAFIDRDNINSLIASNGFSGEIGILSIDIDGNDYWVWERVTVVDPIIVIVEYNSVFGASRAVTIPYDAGFERTKAHFSNLYWGCSLKALCLLAERKGYIFVGSNSAGNNAFFVRKDRSTAFRALSADEGYVCSRIRDARDIDGNLTFESGLARLKAIGDMSVFDVEADRTMQLSEIS